VSRKARGALSASGGGARGDPIGGSQFAADRRPGVSHLMAVFLSAGGRGGHQEGIAKSLREATTTGGSVITRAAGGGGGRVSGRGYCDGREFCVAVSGGLACVLELVQPLRHVAWAGRDTTAAAALVAALHGTGKKREVLRMTRVHSTWRRAAAAAAAAEYSRIGGDCAGDASEYPNASTVTAAGASGTFGEEAGGEAEDFMVMCEGGWFGWYRNYHCRFEVRVVGSARQHTLRFGNTRRKMLSLLAMVIGPT